MKVRKKFEKAIRRSTDRRNSRKWSYKRETGRRYKKNESLVMEGKPENEGKSVVTGTLRIK
jgi:hypothetical protein